MADSVTRAEIADARDTLAAYIYPMKLQYQVDQEVVTDYERVLDVLNRLVAERTESHHG